MRRFGILLLVLALWVGAVEPALQVRFLAQPQRLSVGGKAVEVPAGDSDGWCAFGRRGMAIPLSSLVGESGTILARFRIDKPEGELNVARLVFHLRCLSRMVT
ncbi:MAG: hypothetical protein J6Y80_04785, partial [Victivallales bacterium]|nr:hypothetical protein [Victivallales bacterium]